MKVLHLLIGISLFPAIHVHSSNGDGPIGPRSASLGHASVCLKDVWASHNNQGSLGFVRQTEGAAFYETRFLLKELSQSGFAFALPVKKGAFGFCYNALGYKLYRETQACLSYGIPLNENISIGVGMDYLDTRIADIYGHATAFTGEAGFNAKLTRQLIFAGHVYNPFRAKITSYNNERIPTIYKFGLQYIFSRQVFITAEAEKTSAQSLNIKCGIEYMPADVVYIRAGGASYPAQAAFGIGVKLQGLKVDISSMYHSVLGLSPQIGLSYAFGKEKSGPGKSSSL